MSIFQLPLNKYPKLTKFFEEDFPDGTVVHAILENRMPGEIWVDDIDKPAACLILSNTNICFITGAVDEKLFTKFFEKFKSKPTIRLVYENASQQGSINFLKFGLTSHSRLHFKFKKSAENYIAFPNQTIFELLPLDKTNEKLLRSCNHFSDGKKLYGSEENCIQHAWGLALWDKSQNKIASEVFGLYTERYVELSVFTHPNYRRQNLARIVCSQFITDILATGREPIWACDKDNKNSIKLAKALGFELLKNYHFKIFIKHRLYMLGLRIYRYMKRKLKK